MGRNWQKSAKKRTTVCQIRLKKYDMHIQGRAQEAFGEIWPILRPFIDGLCTSGHGLDVSKDSFARAAGGTNLTRQGEIPRKPPMSICTYTVFMSSMYSVWTLSFQSRVESLFLHFPETFEESVSVESAEQLSGLLTRPERSRQVLLLRP